MRKQGQGKKPRSEAVYGTTVGLVDSLTVSFDCEAVAIHIP